MRRIILVLSLGFLYAADSAAAIVNLNARSNDLANPVELSLAAGTYTITPIGTADGGLYNAWNAWGATTCSNPAGCPRTSPTTVTGWLNIYSFGSADMTDVYINGSAAIPAVGSTYFVDPFVVYPDPLAALAHAWSAEFTLSTASTITVSFAIPDRPLSDNLGGLSLFVDAKTTPVPEPAPLTLLAFVLLVGYFNQRKGA